MTIPDRQIYNLPSGDNMDKYIEQFVKTLQDRDEEVVTTLNGHIKGSAFTQRNKWTPVLEDTADTDTIYTYDHQVGWVYRQGLLTDVWFDVKWTRIDSGTPSGNLYVELPYEVATSDQKPFVGVIQSATLAYGTGQTLLTVNAIPGTYRGEIWSSGSGNATANISATTAAGHLIGHVRYIGKRDE